MCAQAPVFSEIGRPLSAGSEGGRRYLTRKQAQGGGAWARAAQSGRAESGTQLRWHPQGSARLRARVAAPSPGQGWGGGVGSASLEESGDSGGVGSWRTCVHTCMSRSLAEGLGARDWSHLAVCVGGTQ